MKSIFALLAVLLFQFIIYLLCFHSFILRWGVTNTEYDMPMKGDVYAPVVSCTRAINIQASPEVVWSYLADLGADRGGFYSYAFLESLYGVKIAGKPGTGHKDIPVGRLIPFTSDTNADMNNEGFRVIESEHESYFVLKGWGEFRIQNGENANTRFFIRTHWEKIEGIGQRIWTWLFDAGHYIMERRMMLGIKDYAEAGKKYNKSAPDVIWFLSVVVSGLIGLALAFTAKGYYKLLFPAVFLIVWQFFVFVPDPRTFPAIILLLVSLAFGYYSLMREADR